MIFRKVHVAVFITCAAILTFSLTADISYAQHGSAPHPPMTRGNETVVQTKSLPSVESVELAIKSMDGDTLPNMTLIIGNSEPIEDTNLFIKATDFYTNWKWKNRPINKTYTEDNPAVKIEVFRSDTLLYSRWAFKAIPFFGLEGALGHTGEATKELGFSLLNYTGLTIPEDTTGTAEK